MVADPSTAVRRRPRDRKTQILRVATRAFSDRGYHAVGIDEIAAAVGVSGPALYRHFPNKYALFVAAAEASAQALVDAAAAAADAELPAGLQLDAVVEALIDTTIENRREGAIYRWERRYLEPADRDRVRAHYQRLNTLIGEPLHALRPDLPDADLAMLVRATLSTIASITAHRTKLTSVRLQELLHGLCWAVLRADLPPAPAGPAVAPPAGGLAASATRERLLLEAIRVIGRRGYFEAGLDEIGAAAGVNASSVYRYFPSKQDLLAAAFYRVNERVRLIITDTLAESTDPRQAATRIAERYAALTLGWPELSSVYFAEFSSLAPRDQDELRALQRQNVLEWVHLLDQVHDDPAGARFRVHAALTLVVDLGRLTRFDARPEQLARITTLMATVMFADAPDRI